MDILAHVVVGLIIVIFCVLELLCIVGSAIAFAKLGTLNYFFQLLFGFMFISFVVIQLYILELHTKDVYISHLIVLQ